MHQRKPPVPMLLGQGALCKKGNTMPTYETKGVCARSVSFNVEDGIISGVSFNGGCNGNQKGIASLVEGQKVEDVIERLEGITCGPRITSCPDQLAQALKKATAQG